MAAAPNDQSNAEQTSGDTQPTPIISPAVLPIRHRRKSVKNRKGQLGYIDVRMTQGNRKMARIRYWDDVAGQHARKRRSTEWRDVTDWSDQQIQLWRMQVIAEAGVQGPKKPIPSEVNFESNAITWLEENLARYIRSHFEERSRCFRIVIPAF